MDTSDVNKVWGFTTQLLATHFFYEGLCHHPLTIRVYLSDWSFLLQGEEVGIFDSVPMLCLTMRTRMMIMIPVLLQLVLIQYWCHWFMCSWVVEKFVYRSRGILCAWMLAPAITIVYSTCQGSSSLIQDSRPANTRAYSFQQVNVRCSLSRGRFLLSYKYIRTIQTTTKFNNPLKICYLLGPRVKTVQSQRYMHLQMLLYWRAE